MPEVSDKDLQRINEALKKAVDSEKRNQQFLASLGPALVEMLYPVVSTIAQEVGRIPDQVKQAISEVRIDNKVNVPSVHVPIPQVNYTPPAINVPQQKAPIVNYTPPNVVVPPIKVPQPKVTVNIPTKALTNEMRAVKKALNESKSIQQEAWERDVVIPEYTHGKPMPVLMVNTLGKPWEPLVGARSVVAQMIKNEEGRIAKFGEGTSNDALRVVHATDVSQSVSITGSMETKQVSGVIDSVNVVQLAGTGTAVNSGVTNDGTLRVVQAVDSVTSVNIVSGSASGTEYTDGVVDTTPTGTVAMGNTGEDGANIFALRTHNGIMDSSTLRVLFATDSVASVNIVSGSSAGTQYTDGEKDATPVGTLAMGYDGEESEFALRTHSGVAGSGVLRVVHVNDVGLSVSATQVTSPWVVSATDLDIRDLDSATDDVSIYQVSGAAWSTNVVDAFGSTAVNSVFNADNRLRVSVETGGSGLTDSELRASSVPVMQVSGFADSVNVVGFTASVNVVGSVASDVADDGEPPVKVGGVARTANPTAVAAGDRVGATFDDLGRQVFKQLNVRDLIRTSYTSLANGTETSMFAGASGEFHDLIHVMCANQSDVAVAVDFRSGTGGSVMFTVEVPASGTAGVAPTVPYKQNEADQAWTVDMGDITGTTVNVSAQYSLEV